MLRLDKPKAEPVREDRSFGVGVVGRGTYPFWPGQLSALVLLPGMVWLMLGSECERLGDWHRTESSTLIQLSLDPGNFGEFAVVAVGAAR